MDFLFWLASIAIFAVAAFNNQLGLEAEASADLRSVVSSMIPSDGSELHAISKLDLCSLCFPMQSSFLIFSICILSIEEGRWISGQSLSKRHESYVSM